MKENFIVYGWDSGGADNVGTLADLVVAIRVKGKPTFSSSRKIISNVLDRILELVTPSYEIYDTNLDLHQKIAALGNSDSSFKTLEEYSLNFLIQNGLKIYDEAGNDISEEYCNDKKLSSLEIDRRTRLENKENKGTSTMENIKDAVVSSAQALGSAAALGAKLAGVQRANQAGYDYLASFISNRLGVDPDKMNDPLIKESIMLLLPMVSHPLATIFEAQIPQAKYVKGYAELSMTDGVMRNSGAAIEFIEGMFKAMTIAGENKPEVKRRVREPKKARKRIDKQVETLDLFEEEVVEENKAASNVA